MSKRFLLLAASVLCLITVLCFSKLRAGDASNPTNWKTLEIRCAQANVTLAEARLAEAEAQNKLAAGTNSPDMIKSLQANVKVAHDRLQQLQGKGGNNSFGPQIVATMDRIQTLTENHQQSLQANQLQAGAVPDTVLRRQQAEIDVAKARLAALQVLSDQPLPVRLEWQIHQLQDDVAALWARPLLQD
ncbi:MAG TPA: hypothetical protein VHE81_17195 [Lacipirellulaceae bacterium]|nr:hypothetical protein [Lacipirellulaceae bacterium]